MAFAGKKNPEESLQYYAILWASHDSPWNERSRDEEAITLGQEGPQRGQGPSGDDKGAVGAMTRSQRGRLGCPHFGECGGRRDRFQTSTLSWTNCNPGGIRNQSSILMREKKMIECGNGG